MLPRIYIPFSLLCFYIAAVKTIVGENDYILYSTDVIYFLINTHKILGSIQSHFLNTAFSVIPNLPILFVICSYFQKLLLLTYLHYLWHIVCMFNKLHLPLSELSPSCIHFWYCLSSSWLKYDPLSYYCCHEDILYVYRTVQYF